MSRKAGKKRSPSAADGRPDDDEAIVRSVLEPDRFAQIYDGYFAQIYGYLASRLGRDVADDLAAETFLIAFRKRGRFDPARGTVRPWLYGIATTLIGQHRRGRHEGTGRWPGPAVAASSTRPRATTIVSQLR